MAIKTKEELKAYFEQGDFPSEQEFADLIDTIFSISNSGNQKIIAGEADISVIYRDDEFSHDMQYNYAESGVNFETSTVVTVIFPNLIKNYSEMQVGGVNVQFFSFPLLEESGPLDITSDVSASLSIPNLTKCTELGIRTLDASISLPDSMIAGGCSSPYNTALTSFNLNNLNTVDVYGQKCGFSFTNSTSLSSVTSNTNNIAGGNLLGTTYFMFNNCALTTASENTIMTCFDNGGAINGVLNMSGGANAPLDAAGLILKASLEGKGWTVITN